MIILTREKIEKALNSVDSDWCFTGSKNHFNVGPMLNWDINWKPERYESALKAIGANITYNRMIVCRGNKFEAKTGVKSFQIHY